LHPTQFPAPSQTLPPGLEHVVPAAAGTVAQQPAVHTAGAQALVDVQSPGPWHATPPSQVDAVPPVPLLVVVVVAALLLAPPVPVLLLVVVVVAVPPLAAPAPVLLVVVVAVAVLLLVVVAPVLLVVVAPERLVVVVALDALVVAVVPAPPAPPVPQVPGVWQRSIEGVTSHPPDVTARAPTTKSTGTMRCLSNGVPFVPRAGPIAGLLAGRDGKEDRSYTGSEWVGRGAAGRRRASEASRHSNGALRSPSTPRASTRPPAAFTAASWSRAPRGSGSRWGARAPARRRTSG